MQMKSYMEIQIMTSFEALESLNWENDRLDSKMAGNFWRPVDQNLPNALSFECLEIVFSHFDCRENNKQH